MRFANSGRHLAQMGRSLSAKYRSRMSARHSEQDMYGADAGGGCGGSGALPLTPLGGDDGGAFGGSFERAKLSNSWSPRSPFLGSVDMGHSAGGRIRHTSRPLKALRRNRSETARTCPL